MVMSQPFGNCTVLHEVAPLQALWPPCHGNFSPFQLDLYGSHGPSHHEKRQTLQEPGVSPNSTSDMRRSSTPQVRLTGHPCSTILLLPLDSWAQRCHYTEWSSFKKSASWCSISSCCHPPCSHLCSYCSLGRNEGRKEEAVTAVAQAISCLVDWWVTCKAVGLWVTSKQTAACFWPMAAWHAEMSHVWQSFRSLKKVLSTWREPGLIGKRGKPHGTFSIYLYHFHGILESATEKYILPMCSCMFTCTRSGNKAVKMLWQHPLPSLSCLLETKDLKSGSRGHPSGHPHQLVSTWYMWGRRAQHISQQLPWMCC